MSVSAPRSVGEVLRILRMRTGLSAEKVAEQVDDLSPNTLRRYERDEEMLTAKRLQTLARIVAFLADELDEPADAAWAEVRRLHEEELNRQLLEAEAIVVGTKKGDRK